MNFSVKFLILNLILFEYTKNCYQICLSFPIAIVLKKPSSVEHISYSANFIGPKIHSLGEPPVHIGGGGFKGKYNIIGR